MPLDPLDCETCGKCINVCPNDAVFRYPLMASRAQQIAIFADVCNRCGNCDVVCPEDGGPFARKPNVFGSLDSLEGAPDRDGLFVEMTAPDLITYANAAFD